MEEAADEEGEAFSVFGVHNIFLRLGWQVFFLGAAFSPFAPITLSA